MIAHWDWMEHANQFVLTLSLEGTLNVFNAEKINSTLVSDIVDVSIQPMFADSYFTSDFSVTI